MVFHSSLFILLFPFIYADNNQKTLETALFYNYSRYQMPTEATSKPIVVTFELMLQQIVDVHESDETITTKSWIHQSWVDSNLKWNPSDYDDVTSIRTQSDQIWSPDITLSNRVSAEYSDGPMVTIKYDGKVSWSAGATLTSVCKMDIRNFPFDTQDCSLSFMSWGYNINDLDIQSVSVIGDSSAYTESDEWELISHEILENQFTNRRGRDNFAALTVRLVIRRRPQYFVYNLIMPCILITFIALMALCMPNTDGNKVVIGVIAFIGVMYLLLILAGVTPPNSATLPSIGIYYGVTLCLVTVIIILTVITVGIHRHGQFAEPLSQTTRIFFLKYLARFLLVPTGDILREKLKTANRGSHSGFKLVDNDFDHGKDVSRNEADDVQGQILSTLRCIESTIDKTESRMGRESNRKLANREWQTLAIVIDRLFFVIFFIIFLVITILVCRGKL